MGEAAKAHTKCASPKIDKIIKLQFANMANRRSPMMLSAFQILLVLLFQSRAISAYSIVSSKQGRSFPSYSSSSLNAMKRPLLDQVAAALFRLEQNRVESSSVIDGKGRVGEPMEWSEEGSLANRFSEVMAGGIGYQLKQLVADIVAGNNFDRDKTKDTIQKFINENNVAMFSFTTCPFCRRAKDYLTEQGIKYAVLELDELPDNEGNEIRAVLGRQVKRTSVPCIFINGQFIGGCNDGPGLLPLAKSGELQTLLNKK